MDSGELKFLNLESFIPPIDKTERIKIMTKQEWKNKSAVTEFILLGFGNGPELDYFLFLMFLSIYILTISGNIFILVLMVFSRHLHTPMYFFLGNLASGVCSLPPFLLTFSSYLYIIITLMKIPSAVRRKKAFSTCSSHLIVVILFYWSILTVYVLPHRDIKMSPNKVFSVFYTILTPLVNPLIYSLRNKELLTFIKLFSLLQYQGICSVF
ncbi:PREDICTED: olfactory receptor 1020-like [Merops nubicus]|uniref:olfactory receptor 1020-like n=1 Tax=Merops nubicus TaxID=57421 RepID=UPI0004F06731|nr:PREDICTED: olfactory receptor 1020-like [Merops nubicus]